MRKPVLLKAVRGRAVRGRQVSRHHSLPAPVGGLNARDSVAEMDEKDALRMENWFPETNDVRLRKGWENHVTGIGNQVESLMPYTNQSGTESLFGAANDSFYDVTSAGSVGAAVVSSLTNARWQSVNFTNSSGTAYLCCFNGADSPQYWDNSSWTAITGVSTPAITGVTTTNLINASVHKRRMWLVEVNTLKAWYLPVDSVGGAANSLDLAGIADKGGHLMATETWTLDGGAGLDDYWVGVTSEGQVVVYAGTDPSSSSTWQLIGVWNLSHPISRRCLLKYRGDLLILCHDGVFPLSAALATTQTDKRAAITDKIRSIINAATQTYEDNFGWQMIAYPEASMLLLNIPVMEGDNQQQYAMNTITQSWGGPFNVDANCWAFLGDNIYFGSDGYVGKFWSTFADNSNNIDGDLKQAFSYFKSRGQLKQWKSMRPVFLANGIPEIFIGINTDYGDSELTGTLTFSPITNGIWDTAEWDNDSFGGDLSLNFNWANVAGVGICAAPRIKTASAGIELRLEATDHLYEYGGIIG